MKPLGVLLALLSGGTLAFRPTPRLVRSGRIAAAAPTDALRRDLDSAIISRGNREREVLQPGVDIVAVKQRGGGGGMGLGGDKARSAPPKKKGKASKKKAAGVKNLYAKSRQSALAKELDAQGVIRINSALSPETADALRDFVDAERLRAQQEVDDGLQDADSRFADLVLVSKRCDLLLPLRGVVITALQELLGEGSTLGPLIDELMGEDAVLQEIACLISEPGSDQQPLHPDTPYSNPPSLYASFIALQDVDEEMGPTIYLPGTHTKAAHSDFYGGDLVAAAENSGLRQAPVATEFLRERPVALGLLKKGDLACYNQQVLHCGSANRSDRIRRQFYISFRNPAVPVKARASMRPSFRNQLTIGEMRQELRRLQKEGENGEAHADNLFTRLDARDQQTAPASTSPATRATVMSVGASRAGSASMRVCTGDAIISADDLVSPSRRRVGPISMKATAKAKGGKIKAPKGFGAAKAGAKQKRAPIVPLAPEISAALEGLQAGAPPSLERFLNPKHFEDPETMANIANQLQSGEVVVLRDAFRPEFAEMVFAELSAKEVAWELNEAYFPDGCEWQHILRLRAMILDA